MSARRHTDTRFLVPLLLAGFVAGFAAAPKPQRLPILPVPQTVSRIYYPPPLTLTHLDTPVLGAQAIDPVEFISEINKERKKVNAPELRMNTTLMKAAGMRADVIKKYQNFSHQDPHEGIELGTVLPRLNFHFVYATENIGMGGISAPDFVNGFMNSHSHRINLLDPRLTETGAAITDGPYRQWYVNYAVQLFAIPAGKDEYLGYKPIDRKAYTAALAGVKANLHPLAWMVGRARRDPRFTDKRYQAMVRQRYILESVLARMNNEMPLTNTHVQLILEFNTLLNSA